MSHRDPSKLPLAYDVAEFLADRECLVGGARHRFLRLLYEYGSFRQVSRPQHSRTLVLISLLLTVAGMVLDHPSSGNSVPVWLGCVFLTIGPIWRFHKEEYRARSHDRERDWQAYCLFLRPVILDEHPGLLNQNLSNSQPESVRPLLRPLPMVRNLVNERGPDFWWSTVLGIWLGMAALLVTHLRFANTGWMQSLIFPVLGLFIGPVIWTAWRHLIYVLARSDTRISDG